MKVLVTGGAGYIGSTISSALLDRGHTPIVLDSLVRGRIEFTHGRIFYQGDTADPAVLDKILGDHPDISCTIHCAALILVPESVQKPFDYYYENVSKSLLLFRNLLERGQNRVIFSSSASIYDMVPGFMVTEEAPLKPGSPYARTKMMMEMILQDLCHASSLRAIALRYFNPIGADPKMRSGIHDRNPSHVVGKLVDVAMGKLPEFQITGTEWPTRDGSGIRDYIHIWDLAEAHVQAVEQFDSVAAGTDPYQVINLGTGHGVTVREMLAAFEKVWGSPIAKRECPPRPGDVAGAYANGDRAAKLLGWKPKLPVEKGIADAIQWGKVRKDLLGYP